MDGGLLQGLILAKKSYSDKVLGKWTENSVKDTKYSPAKKYGEKRFQFKCFSTNSFFYMSILYRIS